MSIIQGFSSISIDVPDLAQASAEYRKLLGELQADQLALRNVSISIREAPQLTRSGIASLGLYATEEMTPPADSRGLKLPVSDKRNLMDAGTATSTGITAVDHIVLMTADADDCIRLFGENGYGMRLALDQLVPEWGGRMLFFRCGKMTLEVIQKLEDPPVQDYFWGITYLTEDLEATLDRLDENGVEHSDIRDGRKPGTRVATVKSHTLGIPTLLIQPAA